MEKESIGLVKLEKFVTKLIKLKKLLYQIGRANFCCTKLVGSRNLRHQIEHLP